MSGRPQDVLPHVTSHVSFLVLLRDWTKPLRLKETVQRRMKPPEQVSLLKFSKMFMEAKENGLFFLLVFHFIQLCFSLVFNILISRFIFVLLYFCKLLETFSEEVIPRDSKSSLV